MSRDINPYDLNQVGAAQRSRRKARKKDWDFDKATADLMLVRVQLTGIGDLDTPQQVKNRIVEELRTFMQEASK